MDDGCWVHDMSTASAAYRHISTRVLTTGLDSCKMHSLAHSKASAVVAGVTAPLCARSWLAAKHATTAITTAFTSTMNSVFRNIRSSCSATHSAVSPPSGRSTYESEAVASDLARHEKAGTYDDASVRSTIARAHPRVI